MRILALLKYNDGTGEKELRIQQQIVPQWINVAKQLDCNPALIQTWSQTGPQQATEAMMTEWSTRDPEQCWKKLILKMKDAGLGVPATDLKYALCHMTSQD